MGTHSVILHIFPEIYHQKESQEKESQIWATIKHLQILKETSELGGQEEGCSYKWKAKL